MNEISNLSYIDPSAEIGENVKIDAFAFIDKDVKIGDNCHIRPHASILKGTSLGHSNVIYEGAVIGAEPQDFRWKGEDTKCVIGNNNRIHEHVIINRSIYTDDCTSIGNNTSIMAQTHIGHDSKIGDYCVLGNAVKTAGSCIVENYSILSSGVILHENSHVGKWVLIKGGCRIAGNVPPYLIMAHNPVQYYGVNAYVLRKGNFSEKDIDDVAKCYRHIYQCSTAVLNAVRRIREDISPSEVRNEILSFIEKSANKLVAIPISDF